MDQKSVAAVATSIEVARSIQKEHPQIKHMYMAGKTQRELAEYLSQNGYDHKYLTKAVHYALHGYENGNSLNIMPLQGLIKDKKYLEKLASTHKKQGGKRLREEGKGIFSLTAEERKYCSYLGRKALTEKMAEKGVALGIATLDLEDRTRISLAGVRGRGDTHWTELVLEDLGVTAQDYAIMLSALPSFRYESGGNKGDVKWEEIATELSKAFPGNSFTRHSVYSKIRKSERKNKYQGA
jgi:hypothetical protein